MKILHTADLHLGSTFYNHDKEKADIRKKEIITAFDEIIEIVKTENVKYLLIAGDLFDNTGCIKTVEYVNARFGEITDCNVFISAGNHDPKTKLYDNIKWSSNVHIFGGEPEHIEFHDCVIYGASFENDYQRTPLLEDIKTSDKINILVMHGDFNDSAYNLIDKEMLRYFDYTALGHIHKYNGIERIGESYYAYSGNLIPRGFDEACGGYLIGEIGKGTVKLEYRKINSRKYSVLEYKLNEYSNNTALAEKIKEDIEKENLYIIKLTGECDFTVSEEYIENVLRDECFYIKVDNQSDEMVDYNEISDDFSLIGIFTKNMLEKIENAENEEMKAEYENALKCGVAVLSGRRDFFD